MKKVLHTLAAILISVISYAQVGIGTDNPDNSAMLQVASSDKGFLLPQMTSTQRIDVSSPASGLQVYDTTTNSIWFFNGSYWVNTQAMATVGDVKSGLQTIDHSGWVRLDGRSIGTLSTNQQAAASTLGLSGTLPNAADAYLVQNGSTMGAISGSNTVSLTQANLPNVSFSGTALSAGGHTHSGTTTTNGDHSHTIDRSLSGASFSWNVGNGGAGFLGSGSHTTSSSGNHSHNLNINNNGTHTHSVTVSSGGSATPVNVAPKSLSVNMFIYLGL